MKNIKILIGFFILLKSYAISDSNDDFNKFGFLEIKTDSMNVPFFVDGYYVGSHPLPGPVPVLPGFHEVSYIPPNIQQEKVRDNLTEGIKRVYVAKNDTLNVFLFYDHYLSQVEELETEFKIQNYVGASLVAVLVFVIFSIF
ncbi:MAG: hypothetical protein ACJZ1Q_08325 [Candidatus Neomarinimicrobiota bacterium]|tara:strand:- start:461 stop:886 length:426 start_codon:yes stop_codon:yes gene_type:complete